MATENFITDFSLYLENLASQHKEIGHKRSEPHYFRGEMEEFFGSLRSAVNFPALIQMGSELRYAINNSMLYKVRSSAIIIADTYSADGDYDEATEKFAKCERIGEDIMMRMKSDASEKSYLVGFDINTVTATQLMNAEERYLGVRFDFEITTTFCRTPGTGIWLDRDE